jgi:ATP-dependent protease ClpP protease subunit
MVHGASIGAIGGNLQQLVTLTEDMKQESRRAIEFWVNHSKLSEDEVKKSFLDGPDHYIIPNDALVYGIVDFIVPAKPVKKPLKKDKK